MCRPQTKVFQNDDLRRFIIQYIPKRCMMCHDQIRQGNICISCIWELNNPNIKLFS